jgi:hypothetical protein
VLPIDFVPCFTCSVTGVIGAVALFVLPPMSVIVTPSLYFLVYRNHVLEAHHGIAKEETLAGGAKATVATFLAPMELFVSIFVLQHAATSYIYFICAMPAKYRNTDNQLGIIPDSESNCKVLSTAVLGYQYNQPEHQQHDWLGDWNHHGVALSLLFLWYIRPEINKYCIFFN